METTSEEFHPVDKPVHYNTGKYECIDVLEDRLDSLNLSSFESYCYGNVFKYLWRFTEKNGVEDLKKAKYYYDRLLESYERLAKE